MPTTGTKLYRFINGAWRAVYAELFDDAEKERFVHNITNKMMAIKHKDVEERVYEYWGKDQWLMSPVVP